MSKLQKEILFRLLIGGTIASYRDNSYRLRDEKSNVILKFYEPTFSAIKYLLRKRKDSLFVINKNEVRRHRGNTWVKKSYKLINGAYAI